MKFTGALLTLCLVTVVSVNSVAIKWDESTTVRRDTTPYYTTKRTEWPSTKNYDTTAKTAYPTDYTPMPSTHKPNPDLTCFGHFTYNEGHNVILPGEFNRHHNPIECESSCWVRKSSVFTN